MQIKFSDFVHWGQKTFKRGRGANIKHIHMTVKQEEVRINRKVIKLTRHLVKENVSV